MFSLIYMLIHNHHNTKVKVKSNYFIVRPKVDQRAGLLSLPHLEILPFTRANFFQFFLKFKLIYIAPWCCNTRGAGQCVWTSFPKLDSTVQRLRLNSWPPVASPIALTTAPPSQTINLGLTLIAHPNTDNAAWHFGHHWNCTGDELTELHVFVCQDSPVQWLIHSRTSTNPQIVQPTSWPV